MTISTSNLIGNLLLNSGLSQTNNSLINTAPDSANSFDPASLLGASGSTDTSTDETSLFSFPEISQTAQLMAQQQDTYSKLLIGVTDASNLVQTAQDGLAKGQNLLKPLTGLLEQAEDPNISSQDRQNITQQIKATLDSYTQLINTTQYSGTSVLSSDNARFIPTNKAVTQEGVNIKLVDISSSKLQLNRLDASTPEAAAKSITILNQALTNLQKASSGFETSSDQLNQSADSLQKTAQDFANVQGILSADSAMNLAQGLSFSNLSQTQDPNLLMNSASLLL